MSGPVRVSCVTPTFNRARYLPECIESVIAQGFPGLEHVIVDDGSTDGTPEVLARYGDRVRAVRRENGGQSTAWNRCLELARGEFVAFLDSDDAWLPGKLARQVPLLDADPGAVLLYAEVRFVDGEGREIPGARRPRRTPSGTVLRDLLDDNFMRTPTVIARREALLAAGGFRPELVHGNDWDMWLRVATRRPVLFDPVPSALYRLHGDQMVGDRRKLAAARVRILEDHLDRIAGEAPDLLAHARRALAVRCLKLARLEIRGGEADRAAALMDRAAALAPASRLEAWRIRIAERLRRR